MGACDIWNIEVNIVVYENEMFWLPAEFHFKNVNQSESWIVGL